MAGLFGFFDFTTPGKGVDPDEPDKRAFFRFLDILWHKKGKLIVVNLMYFICILPIIIAFHLFVLAPFLDMVLLEEHGYISAFMMFFSFVRGIPELLLVVFLLLSVFLLGPVTCGLTYVLRNFVRREHAWLSDFWQRAKANYKQGVFLGLLDAFMLYVGFYNLFLLFDPESDVSSFFVVAAIIVFIIYLCMRNTLYLMAVTIELNNFSLIRNAVILTFDGYWRHLLTGFLYAVFILSIYLIHPLLELIILPFFGFSFLGLISVFISYPLVDRRLIQPQLKNNEKSGNNQI
jgi:uncharacterized membrane protein YesL